MKNREHPKRTTVIVHTSFTFETFPKVSRLKRLKCDICSPCQAAVVVSDQSDLPVEVRKQTENHRAYVSRLPLWHRWQASRIERSIYIADSATQDQVGRRFVSSKRATSGRRRIIRYLFGSKAMRPNQPHASCRVGNQVFSAGQIAQTDTIIWCKQRPAAENVGRPV